MLENWRTWEDFWQPGTTDVLRNRFGITDADVLERVERVHSVQRIWELEQTPVWGGYDLAHVQAVHERIFGDVYQWAGVIRRCTLTKGEVVFCRPEFIESFAADIFGRLREADLLRGLAADMFAVQAADFLGDLNALHAFREGNGRTQRAFLSQLAAEAGHRLVWPSGAGQEQRNIAASRAAQLGDSSGLADIISDALLRPPPVDSDRGPDQPFTAIGRSIASYFPQPLHEARPSDVQEPSTDPPARPAPPTLGL